MLGLSFGLPVLGIVAVAIQLPPDADDQASAHVVKSCVAALGADQCTLATDDADARWHATVRWEGMRLVVILEDVRDRGVEVARREIEFSPSDSEEQRWVAAGLMVAAVTAGHTGQEKPEEKAMPAPEPQPLEDSGIVVRRPPARARLRGALDVGGLVGRGLDSTEPKVGVLVRGSLTLDSAPVSATASVRVARSLGDPELIWYGASAGIGANLVDRSSPFALEVLGELLLEQARARATREGTEQVLTSSWRGGAALGVVASYRLARWLVPWISAELSAVRPELEVRVADETARSEGDVRWAFSLGARFQFRGAEP